MTRVALAVTVALTASICVGVPRAGEACGVKLTVKSTKAQKTIHPSANPSRILCVGDVGKVEKALSQAGHVVESTDDLKSEKSGDYPIVLVDNPSREAEARERWPSAQVIAVRPSVHATLDLVESTAQKRPVETLSKRTVVAARTQQPVETGPERAASSEGSRLVESGRESPVETAPKQEPAPVVAVAQEKTIEPAPTPPAPAPVVEEEEEEEEEEKVAPVVQEKPAKAERQPKIAAVAERTERPAPATKAPKAELRFRYGSSQLNQASEARLRQVAGWLKLNTGVSVTLEGHTDASGPSEFNLALSTKRADSVAAFLARNGIARDRIETIGYGEENPQYEGAAEWKNRRVVVVIKD